MRSRHRNVTRDNWLDLIAAGGITIVVLAILIGIFWLFTIWFTAIDCNTATQNLEFLKRCEVDSRCQLNARDLQSFKNFSKLQALSCKGDYDE